MNEPGSNEDAGQVAAFEATLAGVAEQMGGVNAISAAVACRAIFGADLTAWEQRAVNRALTRYRVRLEFPDFEQPAA